jgi:hypothetical protein
LLGKIVSEKLFARKHPVTEREEQKRSVGEDVQGIGVKLLIIHGRLTIDEMEHQFFHTVKSEQGKCSNGEQHRNSHTVHHGHENDVKDSRVLVMDEENRAAVKLNVELNGCLLGLVLVA